MKSEKNYLNILVVEDNPADLFLIEGMLRSSTIRINTIHEVNRISGACSLLETQSIGLILLDLSLPDSFGIDTFLTIKSLVKHIPVIILTGVAESAIALEALQQGAQDYLVKGEFNTDLLERAIKYSIERKSAEEKIHASEENYRQIFYKNPLPSWIYDLDNWKILEVNDAAIQKYGYNREEFLALTTEDICLPEDIPLLRLSSASPDHVRPPQETLWKHKKKNGETMLIEATFYPISYYGKMAMQAQFNDVTEKKRLEQELMEQDMQRQQLIAEAVLGAQEEERKVLGAELHDNINQILATAQLYITAGLENPVSLGGLFSKGQDCIVLAIEEIRKLSKKLTTPVFIATGLKQAIEAMAADIHSLKQIDFITDLDALEGTSLSEVLKITIYRIVQEQLNNILKHAKASRVNIAVRVEELFIVLSINDNGKGFDIQVPKQGIGLINIQNRVALFNGQVELDSSPGKGCCLTVKLNINSTIKQQAA
ncbi:MAG: response regulator [Chitinophagaceae bacterium]